MEINFKSFRRAAAVLTAAVTLLSFAVALPYASAESAGYGLNPINPNANRECRNILNYMQECTYSNKVIFGAFDYIGTPYDNNYEQIKENYGVTPALLTLFYPDLYDQEQIDEVNKKAIEYHEKGAIIVFQPGLSNLYDKYKRLASSDDPEIRKKYEDIDFDCFNAEKDNTNPNRNMDVYNDFREDLERCADILEELDRNGVTVIHRMFVEMNNPYFKNWYSINDEGYQHFINIWKQTVDYFTEERGLDNVLYAFCPVGNMSSYRYYWPGEEYVDIVSPTLYPNGQYGGPYSMGQISTDLYEEYLAYGKPFGFSELGATPNYNEPGDFGIIAQGLREKFPKACWVNIWADTEGFFYPKNINADIFVHDSRMVTLDAQNPIPNLHGDVEYPSPGLIMLFDENNYGGNGRGLSEGKYSPADLEASGISLASASSIRVTQGYALTLYKGENCTGESLRLITDSKNLSRFSLDSYKSVSVDKISIENASLGKPIICSDMNSDYNRLIDGTLQFWETFDGVGSWAVVDLQDVYTISRWEVENSGAFGETSDSNTCDYRMQYSLDGKKWKDADIIFGNNANVTNRNIEQIDAQYVKLFIEKPNTTNIAADKTRAAVCEFTVFGIKKEEGIPTDWQLITEYLRQPNGQIITTITNTEVVPGETVQANTSDESPQDTAKTGEAAEENDGAAENSHLLIWIVCIAAVILIAGLSVFLIKRKKRKSPDMKL